MLTRPVGRPPNRPQRFYHSFQYQAQSWSRPRRVVAKVEWHTGELFPRVGFIVTNLGGTAVVRRRGPVNLQHLEGSVLSRGAPLDSSVASDVREHSFRAIFGADRRGIGRNGITFPVRKGYFWCLKSPAALLGKAKWEMSAYTRRRSGTHAGTHAL